MNQSEEDLNQKNSKIYKQLLEFTNYIKEIKQNSEIDSHKIEEIKQKYSNIQSLIQQGHENDDKIIKEFYLMNYELFDAIDMYVSSQKNFEQIEESFDFVKYNSEGSLVFEEGEFIGKSQLQKFDKSWGTFYDSFFNASKKLKDTIIEKSLVSNADEQLKNLEIQQRTKNVFLYVKKKILFKSKNNEWNEIDQKNLELQEQNIQYINKLSQNIILNEQVKQQLGQINELINTEEFEQLCKSQEQMQKFSLDLKKTFTIITTQNSRKEIQNHINNDKQLQEYQQKRQSQFSQLQKAKKSQVENQKNNDNTLNLRSLLLSRNQSPHLSVNNTQNSNINISDSKNYYFKESEINKQINFFEDTQELDNKIDEQSNSFSDQVDNKNQQQKIQNDQLTNSFSDLKGAEDINDQFKKSQSQEVQDNMEKTLPKTSNIQYQSQNQKSQEYSNDDITVNGNIIRGQNYSYRNPLSLLDSQSNSNLMQNDLQQQKSLSKINEQSAINEDLNQLMSLENISSELTPQKSVELNQNKQNENNIEKKLQDKTYEDKAIQTSQEYVKKQNVKTEIPPIKNKIKKINSLQSQERQIDDLKLMESLNHDEQPNTLKIQSEKDFQNNIQFNSFTQNQNQFDQKTSKESFEQQPPSILKSKQKGISTKQKKKVKIQEDGASKSEIISKKDSEPKLFQSFQNPQIDMQVQDVRIDSEIDTYKSPQAKKDSLAIGSKQNIFRNSRDESFQKFDRYLEQRNSLDNYVNPQELIDNEMAHSNSQFSNRNRYKTLLKKFEKNIKIHNNNIKFIDTHFQPNFSSLNRYYEGEIKWAQYYWKRISYMVKNQKNILFKNKNVQCLPLVSNSFFNIIVYGLQHIGAIYKDTMVVDFDLEEGQFTIKNKKNKILLDDFLPVSQDLSLYNFDKLNFFYNILEKYLAKIFGSYQQLEYKSFEEIAKFLNFKTTKIENIKYELENFDKNSNDFIYFIQKNDQHIYFLKQENRNNYMLQNNKEKKQYTQDELILNFDCIYELKFSSL